MYPKMLICFCLIATVNANTQEQSGDIDTLRSLITIHVGKSGILAVAAHEHWIEAPIARGTINSGGKMPGVEFTVDASKLTVRPERGTSKGDQTEVQANMQTKVLESFAYPTIVFRSTRARPLRENAWNLSGELRLHGVTRSLTLDVVRENDAYVGSVSVKQTDFGIQPIRIGGGVVRVKDELEITFRVYVLAH